MPEHEVISGNTGSGQVTLMHLLLGIAFCMPIGMAMPQLKNSGGGLLRYVVAAPATLILGILIVFLEWKLGKAIWLRCQRYSKKAQNVVAFGLFVLQLLWIVVGTISGFKVATFVAEHVAR